MSRLVVGVIAGILFGLVAVGLMLPLQFPDKRSALIGAFLNRLGIGTIVGAVMGSPQTEALHLAPWLIGLGIGVLLSAPDAVITKAYAPILVIGAIGGAAIGWLVAAFGG